MTSMQELQQSFYDRHQDYQSAHLRHAQLKIHLSGLLQNAAGKLADSGLPLRILEIGAGHGGYTEVALALGGQVTAVEMSSTALEGLRQKFRTNPKLTGVFDADGSLSSIKADNTLVLAVSVLHHIPDYLAFLDVAQTKLTQGGSILAIQDPLWYPRVPALQHRAERAAYLAWRLGRGDLKTGFASLVRRLRKAYDETKPGDMVEYHVVRDGVDEQAIATQLKKHFNDVNVIKYWSTPSVVAQRLGHRLGWANTFAVYAEGYIP